jgi:N-acetylneuraminic acid mutarotase
MSRTIAVVLALLIGAPLACGSEESPASAPGNADDASTDGNAPDAGKSDGPTPIDEGGIAATWVALPPLPSPQQEVAVVALGGKVYVIGGFDVASQPTAAVNVYDPKAKRWAAAAPLPQPLHHVNAAVVGDRIYVAGALSSVAFTAVGTTLAYDPVANAWTPKAAMPAGTQRGGSFVGAIGTTIYVAGGLRNGSVADFSSYDTVKDEWAALPALDAAVDHGMTAVFAGKLYAIGGRSAVITSHVARVDMFDPATSKWTPRAPMPTSRGGAAAAVAKGVIVVAGGEGNAALPSGVFADVEAYDPVADKWITLPSMRTPRHGTGAATVDDVVYVPGGGDVQAFGATAIVEALVF